ncbi:hypothetical protein ABID22_002149 [Pontibacter aydingkolensis]|uniref:Uncharacterized protein n=1 Tax=Pontibacter aydingkolensis TaxID=1911536 RepID=A0ABS7CV77_9BACT|nr:hypothetical protein [Pontibacter aydingkolensis]MBW7467764.1 hypothetical protein [Pontibacter aydingkolensis]
MTSVTVFTIIILLPIVFIGIGYYWDYKRDRQYFSLTLKGVSLALLKLIAGACLIVALENILDKLLML